ncbi:MAG: glycoside hydrolase family 43 protein [Clostridia bacterium]|nr:glycoside hydrolase family 43 protein [Clostridia bacterium]
MSLKLGKNPITDGYYADPEARFYEGKYWVYVTHSKPFEDQHNLTAFSSVDLINWEKHENIIDMSDFPWIWGAVWAPTIIEKNGKYYLIFASNDIHKDTEPGGLEIAVADNPAGPFKGYLGRPLVPDIFRGAQPIDAHLFRDDDGKIYLYYGGWGHCILTLMNDDMTGIAPLANGELRREITPDDYVEGPCMLKRGDKYFFMWSAGNWIRNDYHVNYGIADSPEGPFKNCGKILESDPEVAVSPGHNGFIQVPDSDEYLIVYHRKQSDRGIGHDRELCIDKLAVFNDRIDPVKMT